MLGKKQSISNEDWLQAVKHIEEYVSKEEIKALTNEAIKSIKATTKGKKVAYAWSGGKDSIVLGHICEKAGIKDCVLGVCDIEYPDFLEWIEKHKPEGLTVINTGQNMEWLVKHPEMLFPKGNNASRWFSIVQHTAQRKYYKQHELDMLLLGRRRADGNYVGRGSNCYTDGKGVARFSPLSEWKHEHVLAYIHYYNLPLPPIYNWPNGYKCGTHPWPARQHTESIQKAWEEIEAIDKSIVDHAEKYIESAKLFREVER